MALGHRYGFITVTNEGPGHCALRGYPGFGACGAWGNPFVNEVEQSPMGSAGRHLPEGSEPLGDMLLQPFYGADPLTD